MSGPPSGRRDRPARLDPTWNDVAASFAAMAAIPLLLWVVSRPLAGAVTLAAGAGLFVTARGAYRLARCLRRCRSVTVELGRRVDVTITERCVCAELSG